MKLQDYRDLYKQYPDRMYKVVTSNSTTEETIDTMAELYELYNNIDITVENFMQIIDKLYYTDHLIVFGNIQLQQTEPPVTGITNGERWQIELNTLLPPEIPKETNTCTHPRKYINSAAGINFLVCPDCLTDLGNA